MSAPIGAVCGSDNQWIFHHWTKHDTVPDRYPYTYRAANAHNCTEVYHDTGGQRHELSDCDAHCICYVCTGGHRNRHPHCHCQTREAISDKSHDQNSDQEPNQITHPDKSG